jgi:pimeloyl-ACP methyl ester carboxylesterase
MTYRLRGVPVDGGDLAVGVWGDEGPLVVAAHGITSHHLGYGLVGPDLGADHRFVAADLRGRGGSRHLPPPYGIDRHAADLAEVVKAYGGSAVVVGHSMGAWVAIALARAHPMLVERLVLIDGGPPLPPPPGVGPAPTPEEIEAAVGQTVGAAYARLSMTFPDPAAYRELWRAHPALRDWNPAMEAYADYDLVRDGDAYRSACVLAAAVRDARDLYALPGGPGPVALPVPAVFLRAERGMFDQPEPMYPPGEAARWLPGVEERTVAGTNHYTIALSPAGAAAVAAAVRGRDV